MNEKLQRTIEWHKERLGKFTSSRLNELMKSGRKKDEDFGLTAIGYILEVAVETLTGTPKDMGYSASMNWGSEHEDEAIKFFEKKSNIKVKETGFIKHSTLLLGGSPDGIIDKDHIIEIKCPFNSVRHFNLLRKQELPKEYIYQIQNNLLVSGASTCYLISYDPRFENDDHKIVIIEVIRDLEIQQQIIDRVKLATEKLNKFLDDVEFSSLLD